MAEAAPRAATYADLEAVPPHLVAEILFGELVTHPRPAPRHAIAITELSASLSGPFRHGRGGPGGWIFMIEPELHLGDDVVVPDIAGWRRERLPELPDTAYLTTPPDWACEALSPSTEHLDRGPKRRIYAEAGVSFLWLLNPRIRLLEAFALVEGRWLLLAALRDDDPASVAPFEAAAFSLGRLWPYDDLSKPPPTD
jgi:Uma2 family endonuclease